MSDWVAVAMVVVLLLANAFFVGAEFALISSRRDRLEALLERGKTRARIVIKAHTNVSLMLAGAQLGITVCSLLLGRLGEPAVAHQLAAVFGLTDLPGYLTHAISFAIALGLITVAHVLLGEMVPKNIAIAEPERLALWLVPVHVVWVKLASPFIWTLNLAANLLLRAARVQPKDALETAYTSRELAELLSQSRQEGLIEQSEHRRLSQTLLSGDKTVAEVLIPLAELTTLPARATVADVEAAVSRTGFSRFPVRTEDGAPAGSGELAGNGELAGYIHLKDVLEELEADPQRRIPEARWRRLTRLPAGAGLADALSAMRADGSHLASAIGEDGSTLGVVALEDLLEEYVGTVRDGTHVALRSS